MKNLSNMAKSNIFIWLSLAFALSTIWVTFIFQTTLWGVCLAVGYYYWGKETGARKERQKRTTNVFIGNDLVH